MPDLDEALLPLGLEPTDDQRIIAAAMDEDAREGMISLIEAPAATGKTIAMVWHALSLAERTGERVLIAVPTLAVMRQTLSVARTMATGDWSNLKVVPIYGRQEYVHETGARIWFEDNLPDALGTYRAWASSQTNLGWSRESLNQTLLNNGFPVSLPIEGSLLGRPTSPAEAAYQVQFETDATVVVCTHAFLARDVVKRTGRAGEDETTHDAVMEANGRRLAMETAQDALLPAWRHLVVDEAHQLAGQFRLALTSRLSYARLRAIIADRIIAGASISARMLANLDKAIHVLENGDIGDGKGRQKHLSMENRFHTAVVRGVTNCIPEDASTLGANEADTAYLQRFRDAALLAQRQRRANAPKLTWTDAHGKLGLSVMPLRFARQLDFCFRSCRSAALLSATLYSGDEDVPHDHIMRQLALPPERVRARDAIISDWQVKPVILHLPDEASAQKLNPTMLGWSASLTSLIARAASDVTAGTLVLFTSKATIDEVVSLVTDPNNRIIVTDDKGATDAVRRFTEAAAAGRRPIWLATGPAWTGVDIPDEALDALVITRLPFGITNPVTQDHLRGSTQTKGDYRDAENDMLKILAQGIGRLVRSRDSDRRRHLWIADGRITGHPAGKRAAVLLERYRDREPYNARTAQTAEAPANPVRDQTQEDDDMNRSNGGRRTPAVRLADRRTRRRSAPSPVTGGGAEDEVPTPSTAPSASDVAVEPAPVTRPITDQVESPATSNRAKPAEAFKIRRTYSTGRPRLPKSSYRDIDVSRKADTREAVELIRQATNAAPREREQLLLEALEVLTVKPKKIGRKRG